MKESKIEWTNATWNPWIGCDRVSPACKNCYAGEIVENYHGQFFGNVHLTKTVRDPLAWKQPRMIFTCSMSDFYHARADLWRPEIWEIIKATPQHTYQILTKRPERIWDHSPRPLPANVWLGTSVELDQYLPRLKHLLMVPATVHFISFEPLLGPINPDLSGIEWAITGGESTRRKDVILRYSEPDWFRIMRDACQRQGVAFFHKQNGGRSRCACHRSWGCRLLDGRTYDEMPKVSDAGSLSGRSSVAS